MTTLIIRPESDPDQSLLHTQDPAQISAELSNRGVRFEQWSVDQPLHSTADADAVLAAYANDVDRLKQQGYDTVDVVGLAPEPDNPEWPDKASKARHMFLSEHTHADDEVRFFVEGRGCFYLRIDGEVLMTICEAGDLIWVPAGTTHWFDMGAEPHFKAIRFFRIPEGWVGDFTGDEIASRFPSLDELTAA